MPTPPVLSIPSRTLVVLVGVSGSGKSTFARRNFRATEIISSDAFRAMLSDDESDQSVSKEAFEVLFLVARRRLELGRLTVVDATSTTAGARMELLELAQQTGRPAVAIILDIPLERCRRNNARRPARRVEDSVVLSQYHALTDSLGEIGNEGFERVYLLRGIEEVDSAVVEREER